MRKWTHPDDDKLHQREHNRLDLLRVRRPKPKIDVFIDSMVLIALLVLSVFIISTAIVLSYDWILK